MGYNLSGVMSSAKQVADRSEGGDYKYQLLYPGIGLTEVRLLFNPLSNSCMRLINRHTIGEEKVACMRTYDREKRCPICDALTDIKNATGTDMYKMASKTRGIALAQFVKANYKVSDKIKPGDIVLFMFPWTVYKEIQETLGRLPNEEALAAILTDNTGYTLQVSHDPNHNYSATLSPFGQYTSCDDQAAFDQLLASLENLNDQILPANVTEELTRSMVNHAADLRAQYLKIQPQQVITEDRPIDQSPVVTGTNYSQMQQKPDDEIPFDHGTITETTVVQTPVGQTIETVTTKDSSPTVGANGKPECFGKYGSPEIDGNMCLLCPEEMSCRTASE